MRLGCSVGNVQHTAPARDRFFSAMTRTPNRRLSRFKRTAKPGLPCRAASGMNRVKLRRFGTFASPRNSQKARNSLRFLTHPNRSISGVCATRQG